MVKSKLLFLLLLYPFFLKAQQAYYLCYFTDKPIWQEQLANVSDYFSQESIDRRTTFEIDYEENDFPIHRSYIDSLISWNIDVKLHSKWFNAVLVFADTLQIDFLKKRLFIRTVEFVSRVTTGKNTLDLNDATTINTIPVGSHFVGEDLFKVHKNRGRGIKIAVMDGGFLGVNTAAAFKHLYSEGRITAFNILNGDTNVYQYHGHGTEVLSIMAADNGLMPAASYELYLTEDVSIESRLEEVFWLKAAEMADSSGVDIINTSLGYSLFHTFAEEDYQLSDVNGETSIISRAATVAISKGMVMVASAGNDGQEPTWGRVTFPGDVQDAITVGAVNQSGEYLPFSSRGPTEDGRVKPEIAALGEGVNVVNQSGNADTGRGTSYSAPAITAVCDKGLIAKSSYT